MSIERLREDDWDELRRARLRALLDAPSTFWASYADEARNSEQQWRSFAGAAAWFVVRDGSDIVGLAAGLLRAESSDEPELISMWVDPACRRRGVASQLVTAVEAWAAATGARAMVLWVTDGNTAALRLYERHGFVLTGESAPLPRDPTVAEHRMRAALRPDGHV